MRSVRIPHPLHSSELSRTHPGSSPKSPPLIVLVLELVLVLVFSGLQGGRSRVVLSMALFSVPKSRLVATSKIEDEDEDETIMGNEAYRQGTGSASLIAAT